MTLLVLLVVYAIALSTGLALSGLRAAAATSGGAPRRRPTRILIVGATGGTGRQLVSQALERGHRVTALVRKEPSGEARPGLITLLGNVLDPSSLDRAARGQDAVFSALGHKQWFRPTRILSEGTRNLVEAMRRCGVRRFVCETALGISDAWWQMGLYYSLFVRPIILPLYFWDKTRQEAIIRA